MAPLCSKFQSRKVGEKGGKREERGKGYRGGKEPKKKGRGERGIERKRGVEE